MPVDGKTNLVSQIRLENRFRFSHGVLRNQVAYLLDDQIFLFCSIAVLAIPTTQSKIAKRIHQSSFRPARARRSPKRI